MGRMAQIMGIVNVTPDSFSDGGRYLDHAAAVAHGRTLAGDGAAILDIGGESSRPGAAAVGVAAELERVLPVIEGLTDLGLPLSIDTSKAAVAARALEAGATIVNDVTALADPEMAAVCAERDAGLVLMHMQGTPRTMQRDPSYEDLIGEIGELLGARLDAAAAAGVERKRVWLDPGIGFGKTLAHNLELLRRLGELRGLGQPLLVGVSRKSFIGTITGRAVGDRVGGSLAAGLIAVRNGADLLRVHDVRETAEALAIATAIARTGDWRREGDRLGVAR